LGLAINDRLDKASYKWLKILLKLKN
jgi:hypothetical protein